MQIKITSKNEKTIYSYAVKGYRAEECTDMELLKALAAQCYANYSMRFPTPLYENAKHTYLLAQIGMPALYDTLTMELEKRGYEMSIECGIAGVMIQYQRETGA